MWKGVGRGAVSCVFVPGTVHRPRVQPVLTLCSHFNVKTVENCALNFRCENGSYVPGPRNASFTELPTFCFPLLFFDISCYKGFSKNQRKSLLALSPCGHCRLQFYNDVCGAFPRGTVGTIWKRNVALCEPYTVHGFCSKPDLSIEN